MSFEQEILTPEQARVLAQLAPLLTGKGFYLAGGLGLALQVQHRGSIDLDFFRREAIDDPLELATELVDSGIDAHVTDVSRNTLYVEVQGVPVSAMTYRYPLIAPPIQIVSGDTSLLVASLMDIGCMKLSALVSRVEKKDYFDLAIIATTGIPLRDLLTAYQQKMGVDEVVHVIMALTYFADVEKQITHNRAIDAVGAWENTKVRLSQWVQELTRTQQE